METQKWSHEAQQRAAWELDTTWHCLQRQARRNVSSLDVEFVLRYGRRVRAAGALHVFLGRRDIPQDKETSSRFGHLEGTTLVMDDTGVDVVLITTYRNRRALKKIRSKAKYDRSGCTSGGRERS
ncbi:MAG: hypothetical protein NVS4B8_17410 [Herpetosiphon sp.]